MKLAHKVSLRVFCYPEDDYESLKNGLIWLSGLTEEELKKVKLKSSKAEGFDKETIVIHSLELEKNKHCNNFLELLNESLSKEDKDYLLSNRKPDDQSNFYLRFDKEAVQEKLLELTESGNCYHVKISVAAFPSNSENALEVVKQIFKYE